MQAWAVTFRTHVQREIFTYGEMDTLVLLFIAIYTFINIMCAPTGHMKLIRETF